MWMSRFLMIRVCELLEVNVSFDPKPMEGDWNGAGCHTNFSTAAMRQNGGYQEILRAVEKLGPKHAEHIQIYGSGNERRLTGRHETASMEQFSYGLLGCFFENLFQKCLDSLKRTIGRKKG